MNRSFELARVAAAAVLAATVAGVAGAAPADPSAAIGTPQRTAARRPDPGTFGVFVYDAVGATPQLRMRAEPARQPAPQPAVAGAPATPFAALPALPIATATGSAPIAAR